MFGFHVIYSANNADSRSDFEMCVNEVEEPPANFSRNYSYFLAFSGRFEFRLCTVVNIIILDRNTQAADTAYTRDKLQSQFFSVPYFRRRFFQHALNAMRRDVTAAFMISHRSTKEAVYVFTAAGQIGRAHV